ncbi:MAG: hypothetical protein RL380_912 [Verrucomicrobiota bacterium]|jgi:transglutaminase-like putative cysteine protease
MKIPPLLLGAALLFWGWQADLLVVGGALALVMESPRLLAVRWEISDDDFKRIWSFCLLALLAALLYAFSEADGAAALTGVAESPGRSGAQRALGQAGSEAAKSGFRWMPMIFFLFVVAQRFSTREKILLATISPLFWRRRAAAKKNGEAGLGGREFNPAFPYFALCLLAASFHPNEAHHYFWGCAALVAWALWTQRAARFGVVVWLLALLVGTLLGFGGQRGLGNFQAWFTRLNAAWMADMIARPGVDATKSQTRLGQIGRLAQSRRIVIRVATPPGTAPPPLLREASYTSYGRSVWRTPGPQGFGEVLEQTGVTSWELLPRKKTSAHVTIASYLARRRDLLPLPSGVARLEKLDMDAVRTNDFGAVQAEGRGLALFDAHYAPGATLDSPPNTNWDFALPREETNTVLRVAAELQLPALADREKLAAVQNYFSTRFTYRLWQAVPRGQTNTALARFLTETHSGHCEYFATATVLLLRAAGVPARYAVGYAVHEESAANRYVVRLRDGHAWCLVWNAERKIWEDFDTTPSSFSAEEAKRASAWQSLSDAWERVWFEFSKFRWSQTNWRQYLLWGLLPVLGFLLFQIIRQARRRQARDAAEKIRRDWPGLDSEFYLLAEKLTVPLGPRAGNEPWSRWLERATQTPQLTAVRPQLREILALHYALRFDPHGLDTAAREKLRVVSAECLRLLAGKN